VARVKYSVNVAKNNSKSRIFEAEEIPTIYKEIIEKKE
jgi:hypothetical protein